MDEAITKRIHISGLTPAITAKDLTQRLASFGTVTDVYGFGQLDSLGQPRKFAYATLQTTKSQLARCMNLLSGVTWKGAKLRLGEAKPDFAERIAQENLATKRAAEAAEADAPPAKRRRLPRGVQGVHATDMSLVTPENAAGRAGWRVTPLGRVVRPIRVRPEHPLPDPLAVAQEKARKKDTGKEKKKKRVRDPPTRARRRTIDPTKWGSQLLKGIFLENAGAMPVAGESSEVRDGAASFSEDEMSADEEHGEEDDSDDELDEDEEREELPLPPRKVQPALAAQATRVQHPQPQPTLKRAKDSGDFDLKAEKNNSLGLLQSLFGNREDWEGRESVDSDADEDDGEYDGDKALSHDPAPLRTTLDEDKDSDEEDENEEEGADEENMDVDEPGASIAESAPPEQASPAPAQVQKTKLKDLFAPRPDDAGFSLLGHLDLDLELDDDVPFDLAAPAASEAQAPHVHIPTHTPAGRKPEGRAAVTLDPSRALFFPPINPSASQRAALDPTNWRTWFYRTDTDEAIRTRWEETKGELTAGWRRRHREAVKSRRRRGGGGAEVDGIS